MSPTSHGASSPLAERAAAHIDEITSGPVPPKQGHMEMSNGTVPDAAVAPIPQISPSNQARTDKEYVSNIGVLTSSLPMYHNQFMQARKADLDKIKSHTEAHENEVPNLSLDAASPERSSEEQAETARRLKPHSRSTIQLQNITAHAGNPESVVLDMKNKSRHKTPRWQFGIRSRNEPVDAIKCLYKALDSMGDCQWQINPPKEQPRPPEPNGDGSFPVNVQGATHIISKAPSLSESPETERRSPRRPVEDQGQFDGEANDRDSTPTEWAQESGHESEKDGDIDPHVFPPDYAPKDPWCIHVRWEKKGMSPPGATGTSSAQSSKIDLVTNDSSNRRGSVLGSLSSAQGSATSFSAGDSLTNFNETACFVYMDLQIYVLEAETYLVDFKSAGYETIVGERQVRDRKGQIHTEYIGSGIRKAEKDVTSPQPFLDLANKLVIHLAKGAQ